MTMKKTFLAAAMACVFGSPALAQELAIELNKLEANDNGCLAYMLLSNGGSQALDSLVLDLYTFDAGGIIGENLVVELAPVPASKMTVKGVQFASSCDGISRVLVNSVPACSAGGAAIEGCASSLGLSSKASAELAQ